MKGDRSLPEFGSADEEIGRLRALYRQRSAAAPPGSDPLRVATKVLSSHRHGARQLTDGAVLTLVASGLDALVPVDPRSSCRATRQGSAAMMDDRPTVRAVSGEFVTETFDYDGGRQVSVYVPPTPAEAVVFAGDGQLISSWGSVLESADVPPTMIVGVHRLADETLRLQECSPGFDPERFAAHETFFVEDVRAWVRTQFGVTLPAGRTAVFGVSASGELALALGLRHPDIYGAIFCASPGGGYRPPDVIPSPIPRTYLVAGAEEPFFLKNAARWARALHEAGADVVMKKRSGSHGDAFWQEELPLMVEWAFGRR